MRFGVGRVAVGVLGGIEGVGCVVMGGGVCIVVVVFLRLGVVVPVLNRVCA